MTDNFDIYQNVINQSQSDLENGLITYDTYTRINESAYDKYISEAKVPKPSIQSKYNEEFNALKNKRDENKRKIHQSFSKPNSNTNINDKKNIILSSQLANEDRKFISGVSKLNKKYKLKKSLDNIPKPDKYAAIGIGAAAGAYGIKKGSKIIKKKIQAKKSDNINNIIERCLQDGNYAMTFIKNTLANKLSRMSKIHLAKLLGTELFVEPRIKKLHLSGKGKNKNKREMDAINKSMDKTSDQHSKVSEIEVEILEVKTPKEAIAFVRKHQNTIRKIFS